jgi:hypothetical protein
MKLTKILKYIFLGTTVALVYIHLQMQIIELAYHGKAKEKYIKRLMEENSYLTHAVLTLKSSSNLGGKLLSENSSMEFVGPEQILKITSTQKKKESAHLASKQKSFFEGFSFGVPAEAKSR